MSEADKSKTIPRRTTENGTPAKRLVVIDGNALIHRAFHAIPNLTTSAGIPTNAVYGFASMLINILEVLHPEYIVVTYDLKGRTFRDDLYTEYKATRTKAPQELYDQIPKIKELVTAFKIPQFAVEGFEADDVIATIAHLMEKHPDTETYIATGDRDTLQLVTPHVKVITPHKGFKEYLIYDEWKVQEEFGVTPVQFRDYKALRGDTSDNIPGAKGIGEKTAAQLLHEFGTIENIYAHLDEVKGATRTKMDESRDLVKMSIELVTLKKDIPIDFDLEACAAHDFDERAITRLFEQLEFRSLLKKLTQLESHYDHERKNEINSALPLLFD